MTAEFRELSLLPKPTLINTRDQLFLAFECGLISLYQDVFADYPYFESFEEPEVVKTFESFLAGNGLVFTLPQNDRVIGFSAGTFLKNNSPGLFYIAELGINANYRQQGYGEQLTEALISQAKITYEGLVAFLIRTTSVNEPAINLYRKLGFTQIPSLNQEVVQKRQGGQTLPDMRIFLVKPA